MLKPKISVQIGHAARRWICPEHEPWCERCDGPTVLDARTLSLYVQQLGCLDIGKLHQAHVGKTEPAQYLSSVFVHTENPEGIWSRMTLK